MICKKCNSEVPDGAVFCPQCGSLIDVGDDNDIFHKMAHVFGNVVNKLSEFVNHVKVKITKKLNSDSDKGDEKRSLHLLESIKKRKRVSYIFGIIVLLAIGYFGYNFMYMPHVIKGAVVKSKFDTSAYAIDANVFTKKIKLTANRSTTLNLVSAAAGDDFSMGQIGVEEQLNTLQSALPGSKWTVEIVQNSSQNDPHILWEYSKGRETVRYQESGVFQSAKIRYQQQEQQNSSDNSAVSAAGGAFLGGLLGSVLTR